jgi:hypothetical protein
VHRRIIFDFPHWMIYDLGWFLHGSAKMLLEHDRHKKLRRFEPAPGRKPNEPKIMSDRINQKIRLKRPPV